MVGFGQIHEQRGARAWADARDGKAGTGSGARRGCAAGVRGGCSLVAGRHVWPDVGAQGGAASARRACRRRGWGAMA